MKVRDYITLGLLGLIPVLITAIFQSSPGYMDADYYYAGGLNLVRGLGFFEYYLWNYLYEPGNLPIASHAYWMPLASIVSALGMWLTGTASFASARLFFILVAASIAPITGWISFSMFAERRYAIFSGMLAAIPGFYLAYMGTTDVFGVYMLLGGLWFLLLQTRRIKDTLRCLLLGVIIGLMHLARADGILWLGAGLAYVYFLNKKSIENLVSNEKPIRRYVIYAGAMAGGYLLVMGPWMMRNIGEFGTLLSPGGLRSLWIINYDDLYAFPGTDLTFERWLESGIWEILQSRWRALSTNLQTTIVVQGEIFLTPLILLGAWRQYKRHKLTIQTALIAWILTFAGMTLLLPEVGWRGGFFHSGAGLQIMMWVFAPVGLESFIDLGVKARVWQKKQAWFFFQAGAILLVGILTIIVGGRRVIGLSWKDLVWNRSAHEYSEIEAQLQKLGAGDDDIVLVNNPPGYHIVSNRSSLVIPNGGIDTLMLVVNKYGGDFLILEPNHPEGLDALYQAPSSVSGLEYIGRVGESHLFRINATK